MGGQEEAWAERQGTKSLAAGRAPGAAQSAQIYGRIDGQVDRWMGEWAAIEWASVGEWWDGD